MNTLRTKATRRCQSERGFGVNVAFGLAIIFTSAASGGAFGAVIGTVLDDMAASAWGFAAGAALGGFVMARRFRDVNDPTAACVENEK